MPMNDRWLLCADSPWRSEERLLQVADKMRRRAVIFAEPPVELVRRHIFACAPAMPSRACCWFAAWCCFEYDWQSNFSLGRAGLPAA